MDSVGIRELRNHVAAVVRRAGAGERVIITVDGTPTAQLGPLQPLGRPAIADLAAAGLVRLPSSHDHSPPDEPVRIPVDANASDIIDMLRGGLASRISR